MKISKITSSIFLATLVTFSACSSDSSSADSPSYTYSVTVTNLTAGQPMSPVYVSGSSIFSVGSTASLGLEKLAEGGDNSELLAMDGVSGTGLLAPGMNETIELTTTTRAINIATMLVKTNDGFAGLDGYDVSALAVGESSTTYMSVYDAGTEVNAETNTTVPGFGLDNSGYNSTRETADMVTAHNGIIGNEDGLITSNLTSQEKFNNPAALVMITRTK